MELTVEQRGLSLEKRGWYVTEACDGCGALLGSTRYTRRGEPGAWCSAICRDGADVVAAREERRGGRPRKYGSERERRTARRRLAADRQRAFRVRLGVTQNPIAAD